MFKKRIAAIVTLAMGTQGLTITPASAEIKCMNPELGRMTEEAVAYFKANKLAPSGSRSNQCTDSRGTWSQRITFDVQSDGKLHRQVHEELTTITKRIETTEQRETYTSKRPLPAPVRNETPKKDEDSNAGLYIAAGVAGAAVLIGGGMAIAKSAGRKGAAQAEARAAREAEVRSSAYQAGRADGRAMAKANPLQDVPHSVELASLQGMPAGTTGTARVGGKISPSQVPAGATVYTQGSQSYVSVRDPLTGLYELMLIDRLLYGSPVFYPWSYYHANPWMGSSVVFVDSSTQVGSSSFSSISQREVQSYVTQVSNTNNVVSNGTRNGAGLSGNSSRYVASASETDNVIAGGTGQEISARVVNNAPATVNNGASKSGGGLFESLQGGGGSSYNASPSFNAGSASTNTAL